MASSTVKQRWPVATLKPLRAASSLLAGAGASGAGLGTACLSGCRAVSRSMPCSVAPPELSDSRMRRSFLESGRPAGAFASEERDRVTEIGDASSEGTTQGHAMGPR